MRTWLDSTRRNSIRMMMSISVAFVAFLAMPLFGQKFAPIERVYFTKVVNGADPLPQIVTVTSSSSGFAFTAAAATFSGGDWLEISTDLDCCVTPAPVGIKVTTNASLAPGTYSGEIRLTSGEVKHFIPVTLVVAASRRVTFDRTPSQLSFAMKPEGNATPQLMQISHLDDGNSPWSLIATTSTGANFLKVSANGGEGPARISVAVDPKNLPDHGATPGVYTGQLLFLSESSMVTVPVAVHVGDDSRPPSRVRAAAPETSPTTGATNLFPPNTQDCFCGGFGNSGTGYGPNTPAPDGTNTGQLIFATNPEGGAIEHFEYVFDSGLGAGQWTLSFHLKAGTDSWAYIGSKVDNTVQRVWFNLANGTVGSAVPIPNGWTTQNCTNAGNSWYRCSVTFTAQGGAVFNGVGLAPGDGIWAYTAPPNGVTHGVYEWGQQAQSGPLTDYVPNPGPCLVVDDVHDIDRTPAGNPIGFTISVRNLAAVGTAQATTLNSTLPNAPGMSWSINNPAYSGPGTCAITVLNNVPALGCNFGDIAAGGSATVHITSPTTTASCGSYTDTATATFSSGRSAFNSDSVQVLCPALNITKTHAGNFVTGQQNAVYTVTVSNAANVAPTSGTVTVTETVPTGLTLVSMSGAGWTCPGTAANNCTRSDALASGASYPAISVAVNVAPNATSPQVNSVSLSGGGSAGASVTDSTTITAGPGTGIVIWPAQPTPSVVYPSATAVTTGLKFRSDVAGQITGLRFFKGGANTGSYTVMLYTAGGTLLSQAAYTGSPTSSGWQYVGFSAPVAIAANTTYVAAYFTTSGFAYNGGYFTNTGVDTPPLHALRSGVDGPNGLYGYANAPQFPTSSAADANYWVDVVFTGTGGSLGPDVTVASTHSGIFKQGDTGDSYTLSVSNMGVVQTSGAVTITETVPSGLTATAISGTNWSCTQPAGPCSRSDTLAAGASYPPITLTVNVAANASVSVTNTVTVAGGGDTNTANNQGVDSTTILPSNGGANTIWPISAVPATVFSSTGLTIGLKFRSDLPGTIAGIRFYKGAANTGTYSVMLYSGSGTLLTQAAYAGSPTASGWQQVNFTTPFSITANTTYIAAYFSSSGFAYNGGYFTSSGVDNVPLHALRSGVDGPNGLYTYAATPAFPLFSSNDANYWVDVAFAATGTSLPSDLTIAKTHSGNFTQGQVGATYSILATNVGVGPTSGTVTVTETVPSGLTATSISGTNWTCTQPAGPCSRSDVLAAGASYPAITLTVNVASNAGASVTNSVTVAGGGQTNTGNDVATDPTTITTAKPDLTITKSHTGSFLQGQTGATYTITVSNSGSAPTSGTVTVTETVPSGLTATAISGTNWSCTQPAGPCSRSDALAAGSNYPVITLTVNVAANAAASLTNTVSVAGGGETNTSNDQATDPTTILAGGTTSIWSNSVTPAAVYSTSTAVNVGLKFRSDLAGQISGIRFYKGAANTGTYTVMLYSSAGSLLAQANYAGSPTAAGWQQVNFAAPVTIAANTTYIAAYFSNSGFAYNPNFFTNAGVDNAPLHALRSGVDGLNGVYTYASTLQLPTSSYLDGNYWVDVAFSTSGVLASDLTIAKSHSGNFTQGQSGATYTITVSNVGMAATSGTVTVTDTVPTGLTATAISGNNWNCTQPAGPCSRSDSLGVGGAYPSITLTVNVAANAPASVTNTAAVAGGGETNTLNNQATDPTTIVTGGSGGSSIWSGSATPSAVYTASGLNVGLKFRSDLAGQITGIRFYKGAANTGNYTVMLYSSGGSLLAQANYTGSPTASGWQQVNFGAPVTIAANTTYIAAYFSDSGFAYDGGYFTATGVDNAPLHALRSGVDGPNGLYTYATTPQFPASSYNDANYWVDVVFVAN